MGTALDFMEKRRERANRIRAAARIAEEARKAKEARIAEEARKAEEARQYASKQASVDTEISKPATGTNTSGRSASRSVETGGSPKDSLRIKRKNYSSMYSGAGRNIV